MYPIPSSDRRVASIAEILADKPPLIPVLHVEKLEHAEPLLAALEEAGIGLIEVTLRSAVALAVIEKMCALATSAVIGAGTLTRPEQFEQVRDAGAKFAVSPALSSSLADAAKACGLPYLPGVATPTEALQARELGYRELKFFPADLMGGAAMLKHLSPLYPELHFCPTGGVSNANVREYLALDNVFAAGGIYLAPREIVQAERWSDLTLMARRAIDVALAKQ